MNRQTKRLMAKQEEAKERQKASAKRPAPKRGAPTEKKKRTSISQFLKDVRVELKKVQWPTRKELMAYTVVVFVSVVVLTSYVFGLDFLFSKAVLRVFGG